MSIKIEVILTDFEIFFAAFGKYLLNSIPQTRGKSRMPVMFKNKSRNCISKLRRWADNPGSSDDQKKKLRGVITNARIEVNAVSVTESATFPPDNKLKKFDALPPGHAATKIIPKAMPGDGFKSKMSKQVSTGNKRY